MPTLESLNRVYWVRKTTEPSSRPHRVSTIILGFGIFMVGVVVLTIGLIMGLEFPLYVSEKIRKDQCIYNQNHLFYEQWYRDERWSRQNRLHYWTLENPTEFLAGRAPMFVERGPYVYTEKRQLINIVFSGSRMSYQTMIRQTFSPGLTMAACGHNCSEVDQLAVLNTNYLHRMFMNGGLTNYCRQQIGVYTKSIVDSYVANFTRLQDLYEYLGCRKQTCRSALLTTTSTNVSRLSAISIGEWIEANDTEEKAALLDRWPGVTSLPDEPFSGPNMVIFYSILLGSDFTNHSNISQCNGGGKDGFMSTSSISSSSHPPSSEANTVVIDGNSTVLVVNMSETCGVLSASQILIGHLKQYSNWSVSNWSLSLCPRLSQTCVDVIDRYEVISAFLNTICNFTETNLLTVIAREVLSQTRNQIIHRRSQKELALGYNVDALSWEEVNVDKVAGILPNHPSFTDAFHSSPIIAVSTCLEDSNDNNNRMVREYNGSEYAPQSPDSMETPHKYNSYTDNFPPSPLCKACTKPTPSSASYNVFIEDLYRGFQFDKSNEIDIHETRLFRYILAEDTFRSTQGSCEMRDVTEIFRYPAWVSNPYYHGVTCHYDTLLASQADQEHRSYVDMEPWTGRTWKKSIQLQTNAEIRPSDVEVTSSGSTLGVSYVNQPLPVYWIERRAEIVQSQIDYFNYKVVRLMAVACGGLTGVTTTAVIIMAVSVFVGLLSTRKNRVLPITEELNTSQRI